MSSYHSYFTYQGFSSDEKGLAICAFDADSGNTSAFLGMDSIYSENARTGVRYDYGAKYNEVANIKITLITFDATDFTVDRFRDVARWLSGASKSSWLDLYEDNTLAYSFLCKCVDIQQYKMDSRTIGVTATFESVSRWAYSPLQIITKQIVNTASVDDGDLITIDNLSDEKYSYLYPNIEFSNLLVCTLNGDGKTKKFTLEYPMTNLTHVTIDEAEVQNYTYSQGVISFNTAPKRNALICVHGNFGVTSLSICNKATGDTTIVSNIAPSETITMDSNQIIYSSKSNRIFGEDFNFVWQKLSYGNNVLCVATQGTLIITYRYPIKIGDCVINTDVNTSGDMCQQASQDLATDREVVEIFTDIYNTVFGGIA
jgi:hypothetical protein